METRRIATYDTTLRDGAQSEGVSFSGMSKTKLAKRLDEFGIDYIEGGFPASNQKDVTFFEEMRGEKLSHAELVAFGSTRRAGTDVGTDEQLQSLLAADTRVVTIYGKSSTLHVADVLRTSREENLAMIEETVRYLKERGREVMFDAEHFFDGYAADPGYALSTLDAAVRGGAAAVILCDTNGGAMPGDVHEVTKRVVDSLGVPIGIHAHNDMELAVANSLAAVQAGASQVQGTINGYGERCGNANLVSIMPTLQLKMGMSCIEPARMKCLRELSLFVNDLVNVRDNPHAPYVGSSAFGHKGGAHVNAVRKNPRTFEHLEPAVVGNKRRILVSELSGGSNVLLKAIELGMGRKTSVEATREVLEQLKKLEAEGYAFEAADASFRILIQKVLREHRSFFDLEGFRVSIEKRGEDEPCVSEATVKVRVKGEVEHTVAEGDGPVNALDCALRKALMRFYPQIAKVYLTDFRVRILDPEEATAAKTRVLIESSDGEENWGTVGVSENIVEASWEALVDSVEYKLFKEEERQTSAQGADAGA